MIYAIVGLIVGGYHLPDGGPEIALLVASIVLSLVVGLARGRLTKVWRESDGLVYSQGTALTIGLFLGMVAVKFGLGAWAYFAGFSDDGGFGEVLLMIAVMVAVQAELMWHRGRALGARPSAKTLPPTPADV